MELTPELQKQIVQAVLSCLREKQTQQTARPVLLLSGAAGARFSCLSENWTIEAFEPEQTDFRRVELVLAAALSLDELHRIANGMEHPLIQARLRGKRAYVSLEGVQYRQFAQTMPQALRKRYEEDVRQAERWGIVFLPAEAIVQQLLHRTEAAAVEKCVLTEKKLYELLQSGAQQIQLAQGSIVTPLARDFAKQHQMMLVQEDTPC